MGFFSGILNSFAAPVLTAVGSAFGGPVGGLVGGAIGGALGGGEDDGGEPTVYDASQSSGAGSSGAPSGGSSALFNFSDSDVLGFGAKALGTYAASSGQAETNALNVREAALNREFQRESATSAMDFTERTLQEQREFNHNEADLSRQWQQGMSSSAYQRAVADMQAAGLNPMLAYSQGGASSGGGATATSGSGSGVSASGSVPNLTSPRSAALSSAASLMESFARIDKLQAETRTEENRPENVVADTKQKEYQTRLLNQQMHESISRMHLTGDQSEEVKQRVRNMLQDNEIGAANLFLKKLEMQVREATSAAEINEAIASAAAWATTYGQNWRPYIDDISKGVSSAGRLRNFLR